MEGELVVFHMIDPRLLEDGRIRVLPDQQKRGTFFEVHADGGWFQCSDYFFRQILYGFQTPASVAQAMVAFAEKASNLGIHPAGL
jgi:hypothetical protein